MNRESPNRIELLGLIIILICNKFALKVYCFFLKENDPQKLLQPWLQQ